MRTVSQELGMWGEDSAAAWLTERGWEVIARQFRAGHRDIDLIVQREKTTAFVEVKTRKGNRYGDPIEAVGHKKQREVIQAARAWLRHNKQPGMAYRFDVVGIVFDGATSKVNHIEDAFWCW